MIRRLRSFMSGLRGSRDKAAATTSESIDYKNTTSRKDLPEVLKTPEDRFWNWFIRDRLFIETFITDSDPVIDAIQEQLNLISPHVTFEIGQSAKGTFEFIISAGGVKKLIPVVSRLHNAAPRMKGWKVIAFKPRHATPMIEYGGQRFSLSDFFYASKNGEGGKTDLVVCIRGFRKAREKTYGLVGFLFLDTVLGEYDVMTDLGKIEFGDLPPGPIKLSGLKPLKELAVEIDSRKSGTQ
ncbi:MAG: hypothetical protein KDI90_10945 [Alphaproteobacteria bacterium]|nr:hypothetical protein [Alphaproteobacteria bacterium]MCB9974284.1 hypothetical protein [Rhodospirillales bacterium]